VNGHVEGRKAERIEEVAELIEVCSSKPEVTNSAVSKVMTGCGCVLLCLCLFLCKLHAYI